MIRWLEDVEPVSTPYWMKRLREGNNENDQDAQAFEEWDLSSMQEGQEDLEEDAYVRLICHGVFHQRLVEEHGAFLSFLFISIVASVLYSFFDQDVGSCIVDWNPETAAQIYQAQCTLIFEQMQNPEMLEEIEAQADDFAPTANANQDATEIACPRVDG